MFQCKATGCQCLEKSKRPIQYNDIEAVDEMKTLILESVNALKNCKKRMLSRSSAGVTRSNRNAQPPRCRSNAYSQLSGLEDVFFNDFIEDDSDFIPEGDRKRAEGA
jgi:hypothetical protein